MYPCNRLACLMLPFLVCMQQSAVSPAEKLTPSVFAVDVPLQNWLDDYLGWVHRHPEVMHASDSGHPRQSDASSNGPVMLKMPYLELFSSSGLSLYRGTGADHNAQFLHELQSHIPSTPSPTTDLRPTLSEYPEMVAQLHTYRVQLLSKNKPTLLAITFPDKPFCQAQNDAMKQWEKQNRIRIIEIRLHS